MSQCWHFEVRDALEEVVEFAAFTWKYRTGRCKGREGGTYFNCGGALIIKTAAKSLDRTWTVLTVL